MAGGGREAGDLLVTLSGLAEPGVSRACGFQTLSQSNRTSRASRQATPLGEATKRATARESLEGFLGMAALVRNGTYGEEGGGGRSRVVSAGQGQGPGRHGLPGAEHVPVLHARLSLQRGPPPHADVCVQVPGTARAWAVGTALAQPRDGRPALPAPRTWPSARPRQGLASPLRALLGGSVPSGDMSLPHTRPRAGAMPVALMPCEQPALSSP